MAEADGLHPGVALDVGCGEGADALWFAERGWEVTAVDHSSVALERGATQAATVGAEVAGRITWLQADLDDWEPEVAANDLVSAQFMHLPRDRRVSLHARLAASVAPGGVLLVVGHHPSDLDLDVPRPPDPELLFTAVEVAAGLDPHRWRVLVDEARPRSGTDRGGADVTVHDAVLLARRAQA